MAKSKVSFILPAEVVGDAQSGVLLGDFNNWELEKGIALKKLKNGSLSTQVSLEEGTYQYRYYLNDGRWANDVNAEVHVDEFGVQNCVVTVAKPKAVAKKAPAKKAPVKKVATKKVAAKTTATVAKTTAKKSTTTAVKAPAKKVAAKKVVAKKA